MDIDITVIQVIRNCRLPVPASGTHPANVSVVQKCGMPLSILYNACSKKTFIVTYWWHAMCTLAESWWHHMCLYHWIPVRCKMPIYTYIDGLVQERRNSIANALELCLSRTNPSLSLFIYIMILCNKSFEYIWFISLEPSCMLRPVPATPVLRDWINYQWPHSHYR